MHYESLFGNIPFNTTNANPITLAVVVTSNVVFTVSLISFANAVITNTANSQTGIIHITQVIKCPR